MNARFMISIIIAFYCLGLGITATAASPCDEAKALRRERLEFDVAMRTKRVELGRQILDLRTKDNEMDRQMAEIEAGILKSKNDRVDSLWQDYDNISDQRDALFPKIDELQQRYSDVSRERREKKTRLKVLQLEKRFECVANEPLTVKLVEISKRLSKRRDANTTDAQAFVELVELRTKAMADLKTDMAQRRATINALKKQIDAYDARLSGLEKEVDAGSTEKDRLLEEFDKEMETLGGVLDEAAEHMSDFSKRLLPLIDKFGGKDKP